MRDLIELDNPNHPFASLRRRQFLLAFSMLCCAGLGVAIALAHEWWQAFIPGFLLGVQVSVYWKWLGSYVRWWQSFVDSERTRATIETALEMEAAIASGRERAEELRTQRSQRPRPNGF